MRIRAAALLALALPASGCITIAGGNLPPIEPEPAAIRPRIEQTVGDFALTLDSPSISSHPAPTCDTTSST